MTFTTVLPSDSTTVFERTVERATDFIPEVAPAIEEIHGIKYARPLNVTVAPWLVQEYGLGPISQFFSTAESTIDQGRTWQRLRGTPQALLMALGWIGYGSVAIEDQVVHRRRWHLYQLGMGQLPGADEINRLMNAEYLAGLSDPARSQLWRGWHGYDVRGLAWGNGRFGRSMWGDSSGVRLPGGSVKWSHGRSHTLVAAATIDDWSAFGLDPALETGDAVWSTDLAWSTPGLGWGGIADAKALKTWLLLQRPAHLGFFDQDGAAIGFARVIRAAKDVSGASPDIAIAFDVHTRFGDGDGKTAASVSVFLDLPTVAGIKPHAAWLAPDQVLLETAPFRLGDAVWSHRFQKTVREHVTLTLTIPAA